MVSENQTEMRGAVGLGNVTNHQQVRQADKAAQGQAEAGENNDTWMTPLRTAQAIAALIGDGGTVLNGEGAPNAGLGEDDDFYIDTQNADIYGPKTSGAWGSGISLVGPQGLDGTDGAPGTDGVDGSDGTDAPEVRIEYSSDGLGGWSATYTEGDAFIRFSTDDGGTWSAARRFRGEDGTDGAPGTDGVDGADGTDAPEVRIEYSSDGLGGWSATYTEGDAFIRFSTDDGGTWSTAKRFRGEDGADGGGGGASLTEAVEQASHGLAVGDAIRLSGTNTYAKAQANTAGNADYIGHVVEVVDSDNFVYAFGGIVEAGVPDEPAGTVMFLSPTTPGEYVATSPEVPGQVNKPVLIILVSAAKALLVHLRGFAVPDPANPIAQRVISGTSHTLEAQDLGVRLLFTSDSAVTLTVPEDSSLEAPMGATTLLTQVGTGDVTVVGSGDAGVASAESNTLDGTQASAALSKYDENSWNLSGRLVPQ